MILPNNWICLLAGTTKMRWWVFGILNFGGTLGRIFLIRMFGDAFADPILSFNSWISDHRLQLTGLTFFFVAIAVWQSVHSGHSTLETPDELEEELLEAADDLPGSGDALD